MNKILIVKTSAFGDIVHVYPVIDYLYRKQPNAQIDWVVEAHCHDLVKSHPLITRTLCVSTKKWRKALLSKETLREIKSFWRQLRTEVYDAAFDLQGNIKSGLILSQVRAKRKIGFGWRSVWEKPNLLFTNERYEVPAGYNVRQEYLALVAASLNEKVTVETSSIDLKVAPSDEKQLDRLLHHAALIQKPRIAVCPGSAWKNKQMNLEALEEFLKLIHQHLKCSFLFLWGSAEEKHAADNLQACFPTSSTVPDKLPLPLLQNLIGRCDVVIAMDSLPLHLAGTTATPTFSIFGSSSANKFKPLGKQHGSYQGTCPYGRRFERRCPILRTCPTGACIRALSGKDVFQAFIAWYQK